MIVFFFESVCQHVIYDIDYGAKIMIFRVQASGNTKICMFLLAYQ